MVTRKQKTFVETITLVGFYVTSMVVVVTLLTSSYNKPVYERSSAQAYSTTYCGGSCTL